MPARRFGRPAMVVATLIAFSVLTLVFVGEGLRAFVRKDGVSLGKRDITFGMNWQTTIFTPSTSRSEISTLNDSSPDSSNTPASLINYIQSQKQATEEGSTTVSAILAQGTNTVSFALQGKSDMVSVILANINSLMIHPTGVSNTARDATGLLAIAMAKSNPSVSSTAVSAATPTDLHSLAAFELLKKAVTYKHHDSHGEACECAACISSPAGSIPITEAPPLPTHELMARAFVARAETVTVTITVSVCQDSTPKPSSSTGSGNQSPAPASNSTYSGPKNPAPAPESSNPTSSGPNNPGGPVSNSTSSGPKNPAPAPESSNPTSSGPNNPGGPVSNSTSSGPQNPVPAPENSNFTSPSQPNPPFANSSETGSGGATAGSGSSGSGYGSVVGPGAGGAASASGAVASAASLFSGNSSQPTGNAQPSNNAATSSSASKSTPAENTSPAISTSISPPIASQASAASSGIDNSIFAFITPALSNIVYIISTIAPIAGIVIMGQIWLL